MRRLLIACTIGILVTLCSCATYRPYTYYFDFPYGDYYLYFPYSSFYNQTAYHPYMFYYPYNHYPPYSYSFQPEVFPFKPQESRGKQ